MPRSCRALVVAALLSLDSPAGAQPTVPPPSGAVVKSMGQPSIWRAYTSAVGYPKQDAAAGVSVGARRSIGSPVNGTLGYAGEGYAIGGRTVAAGIRAFAVVEALGLGVGYDWDATAGQLGFTASFNTAVRRGGLFGYGTRLRVDWTAVRDGAFGFGVTMPLGQPYAGRTRSRETGVYLDSVADATRAMAPRPAPRDAAKSIAKANDPAAADSALAAVREAAGLIRVYANFFNDKHKATRDADLKAVRAVAAQVRDTLAARSARYPQGRSYAAVQRVYGAALAEAFGAAVGDAASGTRIGKRARDGLLTNVLLPFDAQFGRVKNKQNDLGPLFVLATDDFATWLRDSSGVSPDAMARALAVHRKWLDIVDRVEDQLVSQWKDSRLLWLPLQLALAPEDHDEQREIDALIERALGRPFANGNQIDYATSGDLQLEFARTIALARDYHVLWIHDFIGRRTDKTMDLVGYRQVADVYYPALTRAVARYDSTGRFTTYLIFLDQNFYEPNDGRLWMTILEDPVHAALALPPSAKRDSLLAHLESRQRALRDAVASSKRLQGEVARLGTGGDAWLRGVVKVHVNITQPSDFTYRSHRIMPPMPLLPDNLMRDHRKLAFYDLTEQDPYAGAMILAGVGIGEHYSSPTWQDRGVVVRGPAALEVRAAARRLLVRNGFKADEIPEVLRETHRAPAMADNVANGEVERTSEPAGRARALMAHNEPGFGRKQSSVTRAMLYSLAPPGSLVVVPDPLWLGSSWAGMLTGAALRGCQVYIIAPATANNPAPELPVLSGASDLLVRLAVLRQEFKTAIHAAGGELRVGLFTAEEDVNDVVKQNEELHRGLERSPWIRELFPFDPTALAAMDSVANALAKSGYHAASLGKDIETRRVQLHQKTQLFANADVVARAARLPEWRDVLVQTMLARARQASAKMDLRGVEAIRLARLQPTEALYEKAMADPRIGGAPMTFYFTVATQNEDARGLMLDGEATVLVSGLPAAAGMVDFYLIMARTTWVESVEEIDKLLPPTNGWKQKISRRIHFLL